MTTYNDVQERDALLDGASALWFRSEFIANRTEKPEPEDVRAAREKFKRNADVLLEMAACYD